MPTTWYQAQVTHIVKESPFVNRYTLKIKDNPGFAFLAGQFITLDLPISDKRLKRWRSYSIASAPSQDDTIELCIVKKYDGLGTQYLFDEVSVGSTLTFKGPDGAFVLNQNRLEKNLIFICTGTGIAPFRSMIQDIIQNNLAFKKIHLIFGARYESDILYKAELEKVAAKNANFLFDVALSREPNYNGYKGYVHEIYKEKYGQINEENLFMLCGWTQMVDDAVANLIQMGYKSNQIIYELYG
jgi:ferredoxin-NADP reductase